MKRSFLFILCIFFFAAASFAAEKEIHWGYNTSSIDGEFGSRTSASGAIYIPQEVAQLYKGCTLKGVLVGLAADVNSVTVFATKTLGGENLAEGTKSSVLKGDNTIDFAQSYTIDGSAFYVGYTYSGSNAAMGCCNLKSENGCWTNTGSGWQNNASQGKTLNIKAVISGDANVLPNDGALLTIEQGAEVELGKTLTLSGRYVSFSPNFTKKYSLTVSIDGVEQKTVDVSKINVGPNVENTFSIELDPFTTVGVHTVSVTLSKFGSVEDPYMANNTVATSVTVKKRIPVRRHVVETYTSLTCGWCPAAGVAMKKLYEQYPDNFVGIEVYSGGNGNLYAQTYNQFYFSGTPTSMLDRIYSIYNAQTTGGTSTMMQQLGLTGNVDVSVSGKIVPGTENKVEATATAEFVNSEANANYRWAFVVTENDVCDQEYLQTNYYAGGSHGEMDGWENLPGKTTAVPPTHVARAIYDYSGIAGSFPNSITAEEPIEYTKVIDLPTTVADNTKLNIIALLFNTQNGEIINAAEAQITGGTSSIADLQDTESPQFTVSGGTILSDGFDGNLSIYTANGEQVANGNLHSGLYIVKAVKNGSVRTSKIMIK